MKRFFKSRSKADSDNTATVTHSSRTARSNAARPMTGRNQATVEGIRKKLAGYQKTEGPARFIQPQELNYLKNGTIEFEAPGAVGDRTMGMAVPFTLA